MHLPPSRFQDFGHFCLFGAEMRQMPGWCADLNHAATLGAGVWHMSRPGREDVRRLQAGEGKAGGDRRAAGGTCEGSVAAGALWF